jgi:hypothetical protein
MNGDDFDSAEIDTLVRELTAAEWVPPKVPSAVTEVPPPQDPVRPGSRWTNVRVQMPAMRTGHVKNRFAVAAAAALARLPQLHDLGRFYRMLGPATTVRIWVGLGALYSAVLTFWPYPMTYFWGLVLYLGSLALVMVSGVWGARLSWDARLGAAHTISLGSMLWAVRLATSTLPL